MTDTLKKQENSTSTKISSSDHDIDISIDSGMVYDDLSSLSEGSFDLEVKKEAETVEGEDFKEILFGAVQPSVQVGRAPLSAQTTPSESSPVTILSSCLEDDIMEIEESKTSSTNDLEDYKIEYLEEERPRKYFTLQREYDLKNDSDIMYTNTTDYEHTVSVNSDGLPKNLKSFVEEQSEKPQQKGRTVCF